MSITSERMVVGAGRTPVEVFTLTCAAGLTARIMTCGATLMSLVAPDRRGALTDVLLGFERVESYLEPHPYFGSLIGRYANRIAWGRFTLDGQVYSLPCNDGPHHLHGGPAGFHRALWRPEPADGPAGPELTLRYLSPDGEGGYPGALTVVVRYTLSDSGALRIDYEAETDRPTIVNLTSHPYFNLAGGGDVLGHELFLAADAFLPVDETLIPTGELRSVAGTPMDFTSPMPIGARLGADEAQLRQAGGGYDHCYVLRSRGDLAALSARLVEPLSGRALEVYTTRPGLQLYTGNALDGSLRGKGGQRYGRHAGVCLEAQHFPDAPNRPHFPSPVLRPGERYRHTTVYRLGVVDAENRAR